MSSFIPPETIHEDSIEDIYYEESFEIDEINYKKAFINNLIKMSVFKFVSETATSEIIRKLS